MELFNHENPIQLLRIAMELVHHEATVSEFYMAAMMANSDNLDVALAYLLYERLLAQSLANLSDTLNDEL